MYQNRTTFNLLLIFLSLRRSR